MKSGGSGRRCACLARKPKRPHARGGLREDPGSFRSRGSPLVGRTRESRPNEMAPRKCRSSGREPRIDGTRPTQPESGGGQTGGSWDSGDSDGRITRGETKVCLVPPDLLVMPTAVATHVDRKGYFKRGAFLQRVFKLLRDGRKNNPRTQDVPSDNRDQAARDPSERGRPDTAPAFRRGMRGASRGLIHESTRALRPTGGSPGGPA
jgi:hypothetical protein